MIEKIVKWFSELPSVDWQGVLVHVETICQDHWKGIVLVGTATILFLTFAQGQDKYDTECSKKKIYTTTGIGLLIIIGMIFLSQYMFEG